MLLRDNLRAMLAFPGTMTILAPLVLLSLFPVQGAGWDLPVPANMAAVLAGAGLIGCGLGLLLWTNSLFYRIGRGTLAPWQPPQRLVVRGVYRHVRNPMISGVFCILLGEAVLLLSPALLGWFLVFMCVNLLYIPLLEEPGLERRFGDEYRSYRANVPRWVPRRRGWSADKTPAKAPQR